MSTVGDVTHLVHDALGHCSAGCQYSQPAVTDTAWVELSPCSPSCVPCHNGQPYVCLHAPAPAFTAPLAVTPAVFDAGNTVYWPAIATTRTNGPFTLRVQNDGNVVIYNSQNLSIWATNTTGR